MNGAGEREWWAHQDLNLIGIYLILWAKRVGISRPYPQTYPWQLKSQLVGLSLRIWVCSNSHWLLGVRHHSPPKLGWFSSAEARFLAMPGARQSG